MQHALALFRTQRIIKIFLEVNTQTNKLNAIISAENGAFPKQPMFRGMLDSLDLLPELLGRLIGSCASLTGFYTVQGWRKDSQYLA